MGELKLRFHQGVTAKVDLDYLQKPAVHRLSIQGDAGNAKLDFHAGELIWTVDGKETKNVVDSDYNRNDMFVAEMKHFLDCVADREATELPLEDGLASLRIVAMARHAAKSRQASDTADATNGSSNS